MALNLRYSISQEKTLRIVFPISDKRQCTLQYSSSVDSSINYKCQMVKPTFISAIRNYSEYSPIVPIELFLAISGQNHSDSNEDVDRVHVDRDRVIDRIVGLNPVVRMILSGFNDALCVIEKKSSE